MTTAAGTRLDASVWRPNAPGRFPILLMRQPYGRAIASTLVYAHPAWYAAHGYIVVVQDVRGTGTSEGDFRLFEAEEADGAETVAWALDLPGSSGRLGMYGFSYQAVTQLLALAAGAPVHALAPAMTGWTIRTDWAWEGGAFALAAGLGWAAQMGAIKARHDGDATAAAAFEAIARNPPLATADRAMPAAMRPLATATHYHDCLSRPGPDPYWDRIAPAARLADKTVDIPMLHIGGWFDQMLMGTLDAHHAIAARTTAEQTLVIGPWTHQPWGRRVGAVDFGPAAASPIDRMQLVFFDRHLKGQGGRAPPFTLFDLGTRAWRNHRAWPGASQTPCFLTSHGLAAATSTDGGLRPDSALPGSDIWVHDPWRPAPSLGGHNTQGPASPGGMQDRAPLDDRADIAVYTSAVLETQLPLCGRVAAELWITADQPSFDVSATLAMVDPAGRSWNLTQGHARFDTPGHCLIDMRATYATIPPGHSLRLSLAGAAFPAFPVNPGTGTSPLHATAAEERVITLRLDHGGPANTRLLLPVIPD